MSKELSQEIHTKADPFIKWLKEAEEESSEEEESDVEVCFVTPGMKWNVGIQDG